MTTLATITSRHNPVVGRFRDVASGRDASGLMLLDGEHLVHEALQAQVVLAVFAATSEALTVPRVGALGEDARRAGAQVYRVSDTVMQVMSPVRTPSGVVALATRPRATLDEVLGPQPALVVCGVDVQDPGNVGALVRASEAGGATAVIFAGASADPFSWKALRGSMGSALRVRVTCADLREAIDAARARGVRVVATVPRGGRPPYDVDLRSPALLLLGGEGPGLPDEAVADADQRLTIPMRPPVESLNVAVAAALLVYEAARQRSAP
jgi:TrmH family RNA methyltransferase